MLDTEYEGDIQEPGVGYNQGPWDKRHQPSGWERKILKTW